MSAEQQGASLGELVRAVGAQRRTVFTVALAFTAAAAGLVTLQREVWEASATVWMRDQQHVLRTERTQGIDEVKRLKGISTSLKELVTSRSVLEAALQRVSFGESASTSLGWLTLNTPPSSVEHLRESVAIEVPKGMEFGASEMIYVKLRDHDPSRAAELLYALLQATQERWSTLGREQGVDARRKTEQQMAAARAQLQRSQQKLDALVREIGPNVLDLEAMGGAPTGESDARRSLNRIRDLLTPALAELAERKALLNEVTQLESQLFGERLAQAARKGKDRGRSSSVTTAGFQQEQPAADANGPQTLGLVIPATFLRDHVGLEVALRALLDLRLQADRRAAEWTPEHPRWKVLNDQIKNVEGQFRREWSSARAALEKDVATRSRKVEHLQEQQREASATLEQLAGRYVEYSALSAEVDEYRRSLGETERRHAEAEQLAAASGDDVYLSVVDSVQTSASPIRPTPIRTTLIGLLLGLMAGAGLAILRHQYQPMLSAGGELNWLGEELTVLAQVPFVRRPLRRNEGMLGWQVFLAVILVGILALALLSRLVGGGAALLR